MYALEGSLTRCQEPRPKRRPVVGVRNRGGCLGLSHSKDFGLKTRDQAESHPADGNDGGRDGSMADAHGEKLDDLYRQIMSGLDSDLDLNFGTAASTTVSQPAPKALSRRPSAERRDTKDSEKLLDIYNSYSSEGGTSPNRQNLAPPSASPAVTPLSILLLTLLPSPLSHFRSI